MPHRPPPVPLGTLLSHLTGVRWAGARGALVDHVTRDSRDVGASSVFVAVPGTRIDGHAFVPSVQAAAVVVERDDVEPRAGVTKIVVESAKRALAELAAALYGFPGRAVPVVAVTGTNGKTTTTTIIADALDAIGRKAGRIGTTGIFVGGEARPASPGESSAFGLRFTTPEAPELQALLAEMRDAGCAAVAMEASSHGLAQHRVDGIPFAVGVFTNLTGDHLDFHGTMENYRAAKARLFEELLRPPGGMPRAVLCADDPAHTQMGAPPDAWTYGVAAGADLHLERVELGATGSTLHLATPDGRVELHSPLVGRHNALNLTAAFGALRCLDVPLDDVVRGIAAVQGVPGRLERVVDPAGGRLVLVDYAHSDDALANVLPTVRELTRGRVFVVFGAGGDRDRTKRPRMGTVAAALADQVVVTSDNPRSEDPRAIADEILAGVPAGAAVHVELDRQTAIRWALGRAGPGDAVLLAGKGHETYQEVHGVRRPFDDRAVAREIVSRAEDAPRRTEGG